MALVRCPDCGKMVSSRAPMCPVCGCPAEYFIAEDDASATPVVNENIAEAVTALNETAPSSDYNVAENPEPPHETFENNSKESLTIVQQTENEVTFKFGPYVISYPAGTEDFAAMYGTYMHAADLAYDQFEDQYRKAAKIEKVLETFPDAANTVIFDVINESTKALYDRGVYITSQQFLEKYSSKYPMEYSYYCDSTMEKYADILGEKKQLEEYRESLKASRGRWQGGGFGLKGAMKGALTASALNLGSDFLHSFGDSSREEKDNKQIADKMQKLYESSKEEMVSAVKTCILNVYNAMVEEMGNAGLLGNTIHISKSEADSLYDNTKKYESNPETVRINMISCISTYPGERRFYSDLTDVLLSENSDINEFMSFWHLEYLLKDIIDRKNSRDKFEKYMLEKGIDDFSFYDYSLPNVKLLSTWMIDYDSNIPQDGEMAANVTEYWRSISENIAILESISPDLDLADYWGKVAKLGNQYYLGTQFEKYFYQPGVDSFSGNKPPEMVLETALSEKDMVELYYDVSLMQNGKKGFAITDKYIYDFKTGVRLDADKVREIIAEPVQGSSTAWQIVFRGDEGEIALSPNISDERTATFMKNVFIVMLVRYYNNSFLAGNLILNESEEHDLYTDYGFTEDECDKKFDEWYEVISRSQDQNGQIDLSFSSIFRKNIKCILGSPLFEGKEDNFIFEYDYEITDPAAKEFLQGYDPCGEYILYFDGRVMLGDRYLYINIDGKTRIPLSDICEALLYDDLNKTHCDYRLVIVSKGADLNYIFSEDHDENSPDWFYKTTGRILLAINVALDAFRSDGYVTHYDKSNQYLCDSCGSLDVQIKILGKQCSRCNNTKIHFKLDEECSEEVLLFRYMESGAPSLSTIDKKSFFYHENMLALWMGKYSEQLSQYIKSQPDNNNSDSANPNAGPVICPHCGKTLNPGVKFCNYCGAKIEPAANTTNAVICPKCGRELNPGVNFCNYCGARIEPAEDTLQNLWQNLTTTVANLQVSQMGLKEFYKKNTHAETDGSSPASGIADQFGQNSNSAPIGDLDEYIVKHFNLGNKTQAIKFYRDQTGEGLKEAKDHVDKLLTKDM